MMLHPNAAKIQGRFINTRLHDQANIAQTSSKRRAKIELVRPANTQPTRQASLIAKRGIRLCRRCCGSD